MERPYYIYKMPRRKLHLYIDCDGVILDTIRVAKRIAKELGYDVDSYNGLHVFFINEANWQVLIRECKVLADAVNEIKALYESGKYDITILTKFSLETFEKYTETRDSELDVFHSEYKEPTILNEEELGKTQLEFHKLYFLRKLFPKEMFPGLDIIAVDFHCKKKKFATSKNDILIEDSIGNFRDFEEIGIGVLFSLEGRENFIYENRDDKPITDEEAKNMICRLSDVENVPEVQEQLSKKLVLKNGYRKVRKQRN